MVFVPAEAVGAVGVPVKVGEARLALALSAVWVAATVERDPVDAAARNRDTVGGLCRQCAEPEVGPRRGGIGQIGQVRRRRQLGRETVGDGRGKVRIVPEGGGQFIEGIERAGGGINEGRDRRGHKGGRR